MVIWDSGNEPIASLKVTVTEVSDPASGLTGVAGVTATTCGPISSVEIMKAPRPWVPATSPPGSG